jgi:Cyclic-phosphate processing Receiver domain
VDHRNGYPDGELRLLRDDLLDDPAVPSGWVHVTTAPAAIALIDGGAVVEPSLDHDLGDEERSGEGVHVLTTLRSSRRSPTETCGRETGSRSTVPTPPSVTR